MKDKLKKYLLPNLPYLFFVYLFDKLCQAVRLAPGLDASEKLLHIGQGFQTAFSSSAPSFHALDICVGILGAVFVRLAVYVKGKNAKKYRKGMEYGSARWGTAADIAPYIDPVPDWNIPLTRTESLTMTSRPKDPKTARNKNILVIGGSGSGKTRFFVKPSIMQMHSSYVITDPKGQLLKETGKMLLHGAPKLDENGKPVRDSHGKVIYEPYRIKVLNTINFSKSMKYNPLAYVRSEKDILKLVNVIIANTKGDGEKSSEDFWVKAERLLYCALIGYIWYEAEPEERNFITLLDLLNACEAREDDETYKSPVDILFDDLAKKQPEHFAVKQYVKFKMAAGKTLKSILVSCGARLAPFDIKELRDIMTEDELELDTMGDRKTALFLIMSDTDTTFNFVIAMLQSQLFNLLCDKADDFYNGRPVYPGLLPRLRHVDIYDRSGARLPHPRRKTGRAGAGQRDLRQCDADAASDRRRDGRDGAAQPVHGRLRQNGAVAAARCVRRAVPAGARPEGAVRRRRRCKRSFIRSREARFL